MWIYIPTLSFGINMLRLSDFIRRVVYWAQEEALIGR